jgi:tetratricopeptide (TPR) repeat protein
MMKLLITFAGRPALWVALILLLALAVPFLGQTENRRTYEPETRLPDSRSPAKIANVHYSKGKLENIVKSYDDAIAQTTPGKERDNLSLKLASILETGAKPEWLDRSKQVYLGVINSSQGELKLRASNNYCVQLIRQNKPGEAIKIMEKVEASLTDNSLDKIARSRSLYNYGRALLLAHKYEKAYEELQKAVDADPTFKKAAQAAGDAALKSRHETTGIPQVVTLTNSQLAHFDYDGAARNLKQAMQVEHWIPHDLYPRLLGQLVRYFTAARLDPNAFKKDWKPLLIKNWEIRHERGGDGAAQRMTRQIDIIYSGHLEIMEADPCKIEEFYDVWKVSTEDPNKKPDLTFLSKFINMVADHYYRQRDPNNLRESLVCYCHAWGLDVKNMEAGLRLANILLYNYEAENIQLDPQEEILNYFIDQLFKSKNREYRRNLGRDWERILKCHIVLATIFEKQNRWVPRDNPRTALFQWMLAENALRHLDAPAFATMERYGPVIQTGLSNARSHE